PYIKSEYDHSGIRSLLDHVNTHRAALSSLGVDFKTYAPLLFTMIKKSIPNPILRSFRRSELQLNKNNGESGKDDSSTTGSVTTEPAGGVVASSASSSNTLNELERLLEHLNDEVTINSYLSDPSSKVNHCDNKSQFYNRYDRSLNKIQSNDRRS